MTQAQIIEGTPDEVAQQMRQLYDGQKLRVFIDPDTSEDRLPERTTKTAISRLRSSARAVEYLSARLRDEATDDPEEIRKAQADLDEMKELLNAERLRSGAAPIF